MYTTILNNIKYITVAGKDINYSFILEPGIFSVSLMKKVKKLASIISSRHINPENCPIIRIQCTV
jgi:hypothetical protein